MIDTCQAGSMVLPIKSPNIIGVGSSTVGQDSLSHHGDHEIGTCWIEWPFILIETYGVIYSSIYWTIISKFNFSTKSPLRKSIYFLGVYVIDRWTYYTLDFLEKIRPNSQAKLKELFRYVAWRQLCHVWLWWRHWRWCQYYRDSSLPPGGTRWVMTSLH